MDSGTIESVNRFPERSFAVIDGALFEDLRRTFRKAGIFARSLFLDKVDAEISNAGPWLLALDQASATLRKVEEIVGSKPAVVFWSCADEPRLYRHLRTLTMARIPDWAANEEARRPALWSQDSFETVFFRHYDPRVLGALLPVLEASQFARIVGCASEIAFFAEDYGGPKRVPTDPTWPLPPSGLLTISSAQCEALIDRRVRASRNRIASFLLAFAPDHVGAMSSDALADMVACHQAQAAAFSIRSEQSIGLWSFMQTTANVDLSRDLRIKTFLSSPMNGASIDDRVEALFDRCADNLARSTNQSHH